MLPGVHKPLESLRRVDATQIGRAPLLYLSGGVPIAMHTDAGGLLIINYQLAISDLVISIATAELMPRLLNF